MRKFIIAILAITCKWNYAQHFKHPYTNINSIYICHQTSTGKGFEYIRNDNLFNILPQYSWAIFLFKTLHSHQPAIPVNIVQPGHRFCWLKRVARVFTESASENIIRRTLKRELMCISALAIKDISATSSIFIYIFHIKRVANLYMNDLKAHYYPIWNHQPST